MRETVCTIFLCSVSLREERVTYNRLMAGSNPPRNTTIFLLGGTEMELKIEYLPIKALKPYEKNTRKHQKKDVDNIARSIEKFGMNDPIGIWKDNIIVEGHGRLLACKQLGMTEVPCVRLDHLTDDQRREYAIAHNATAELSEWDFDILPDELAELDLSDFDFDFDFGGEDLEEDIKNTQTIFEEKYSEKADRPLYEIKGEKPNISDLYDKEKAQNLIKEIEKVHIDDDIKEFLRLAAYRHIAFNYAKIAEYYANAPAEIQMLMEDSALVIIDYNSAIEKGYFKMTKDLERIRKNEA